MMFLSLALTAGDVDSTRVHLGRDVCRRDVADDHPRLLGERQELRVFQRCLEGPAQDVDAVGGSLGRSGERAEEAVLGHPRVERFHVLRRLDEVGILGKPLHQGIIGIALYEHRYQPPVPLGVEHVPGGDLHGHPLPAGAVHLPPAHGRANARGALISGHQLHVGADQLFQDPGLLPGAAARRPHGYRLLRLHQVLKGLDAGEAHDRAHRHAHARGPDPLELAASNLIPSVPMVCSITRPLMSMAKVSPSGLATLYR